MPGIEYGPIKPTALKLGKPVKMAVGKSTGKTGGATTPPSAPGKSADKVSMSPMSKKLKRAGKGAGMPHMPKGTGRGFDGLSELG